MKRRLAVIGIMIVAALALAGCLGPINEDPIAAFKYDVTGFSVAFDAGDSADIDGTIDAYIWDFGDGHTGNGETVTNDYAGPGEYPVTLVVEDDQGARDEITQNVTIADEPSFPPRARFSWTQVAAGDEVLFNGGVSYDPDGGDIEYGYWDFGDDNSVEGGWTTTVAGNGPVIYVKHTYEQTGSYTVSLLVRDDGGLLGRATRNIEVE